MKIALIASAMLGFAAASYAQIVVNYSAGLGQPNIITPAGNAVPSGNTAAIGHFTDDFDPAVPGLGLTDYLDNFEIVHSTDFRFLVVPQFDGRFAATFNEDLDAPARNPSLTGRQIFFFLFDTVDDSAFDPANPGNVEAFGIFSGSTSDPDWQFPDGDAIPPNNDTIVTSASVVQAFAGEIEPSALRLQVVPEPSTYAALAGLLALAVALWRRR